MPEIVAFVKHGATMITPRLVEKILPLLPKWKIEFTQIKAPTYPHLVEQLQFLANVVEDYAEGVYKDIPFVTLSEAVFALTYSHQPHNIIPDFVPQFGRADDSSVVRSVLIMNEKAFRSYAQEQGIDWNKITDKP